MTTPIVDFIKGYKDASALRLHTPGHKGVIFTGPEEDDISEICGADELFCPSGIIAESEKNASEIFGHPTYYSAEGSSLCVRAMVYLVSVLRGERPVIVAARNVHSSFVSAATLCDADVIFMTPHKNDGAVSVTVTAQDVEKTIASANEDVDAVFITTPDYRGKMIDVGAISKVCKKHGALLLVDCAHGAYLAFTEPSLHPMDNGADLCCASAHKTLPALTGAAYLHASPDFSPQLVKAAMASFASTSPSYLILRSLDALNPYLTGYREKLADFLPQIDAAKKRLVSAGYRLTGEEPLKITVDANARGYTGEQIAEYLVSKKICPEYADRAAVTFMISCETGAEGLDRLVSALEALPELKAIKQKKTAYQPPRRAMSIREAFFAQKEELPASECAGRVLSCVNLRCPPAVSPVICGEVIEPEAARYLEEAGIKRLFVVR